MARRTRSCRHNAACASALAVIPLVMAFVLTTRIARTCRESFWLRASISPRCSKLNWSTQAPNMAPSDRVQRDHRRGCLRAFALAVVVMRSALAEIWRSIRSRCALVWLSAAFIRESRSVSFGTLTLPSRHRPPRRDLPQLGFGIACRVSRSSARCGLRREGPSPKVARPAHDDDRPGYRLFAHCETHRSHPTSA